MEAIPVCEVVIAASISNTNVDIVSIDNTTASKLVLVQTMQLNLTMTMKI